MNSGIDPLLENELGKDLFDVAKEQYQVLNLRLKEVQDFKSMATSKVIVPSVVVGILNQECILIDQFHFLSDFAEDMKLNLIKRLEHIEAEKIEQRRSILRNEVRYNYLHLSHCFIFMFICSFCEGISVRETSQYSEAIEGRKLPAGNFFYLLILSYR